MKKYIIIILLLLSLTTHADNPPLPCGWYQQGGYLCSDGNLYPNKHCNGYYFPKPQGSMWIAQTNHNNSSNWHYIYCPPVNVAIDDSVHILLAIVGVMGVYIIRKNRIQAKTNIIAKRRVE